jgi:hypothetical protein
MNIPEDNTDAMILPKVSTACAPSMFPPKKVTNKAAWSTKIRTKKIIIDGTKIISESTIAAMSLFPNPAYIPFPAPCGVKPQLIQDLDISLMSEPHFSHFKI